MHRVTTLSPIGSAALHHQREQSPSRRAPPISPVVQAVLPVLGAGVPRAASIRLEGVRAPSPLDRPLVVLPPLGDRKAPREGPDITAAHPDPEMLEAQEINANFLIVLKAFVHCLRISDLKIDNFNEFLVKEFIPHNSAANTAMEKIPPKYRQEVVGRLSAYFTSFKDSYAKSVYLCAYPPANDSAKKALKDTLAKLELLRNLQSQIETLQQCLDQLQSVPNTPETIAQIAAIQAKKGQLEAEFREHRGADSIYSLNLKRVSLQFEIDQIDARLAAYRAELRGPFRPVDPYLIPLTSIKRPS